MSTERRITLWNIVIHKEDKGKDKNDLFDQKKLTAYLRETFKPNSEIYFIKHDKDKDEDGNLKEEHIHLAIKLLFNQGKTFSAMKRLFPNSHLEESLEFTNTVLYLTHETKQAKEDGKYQYPREEIINVNDNDITKYFDKPILEQFDYDKIEEYIKDRGYHTILDFGRVFGFGVIAPKWNTIKAIQEELFIEEMNKAKAIIQDKSQRKRQQEINDWKWIKDLIEKQEKERGFKDNEQDNY